MSLKIPLRRRRQNGSLILVLVISMLAFLTVSLTSASYLNQIGVSSAASNRTKASSVAESVTNLAVIDFQEDPEFGTPAHADYSKLYSWTSPDGLVGRLTFDPSVAATHGILPSTNNFRGDTPVAGASGFDVAPGTVELLGFTEVNKQVVTVRHVISVPPFSFAAVTDGSFESSGSLLIGQVPETMDPSTATLDDLLPSSLGAGGNLVLSGVADIVGNAQAGGSVVRSGSINIRGEVYENRPLLGYPEIDILAYRTDVPFAASMPSSSVGALSVDVHTVVEGNLSVLGTLTLNNAILYVEGDVVVTGGVQGVGAIVSEGKVAVSGLSNLAANQVTAVLAADDVTLTGVGIASSVFRGMVYTEGAFSADTLTIIGNFVSRRPTTATPGIDLNDVRLLQQSVSFPMASGRSPFSSVLAAGFFGGMGNLTVFVTATPASGSNYDWKVESLDGAGVLQTHAQLNLPVPDPASPTFAIEMGNLMGLLYFQTLANGLDDQIPTLMWMLGVQNLVGNVLGDIQNPIGGGSTASFDFDFNQFLEMRARVRTIYLGQL
jgi:hypothetical protein